MDVPRGRGARTDVAGGAATPALDGWLERTSESPRAGWHEAFASTSAPRSWDAIPNRWISNGRFAHVAPTRPFGPSPSTARLSTNCSSWHAGHQTTTGPTRGRAGREPQPLRKRFVRVSVGIRRSVAALVCVLAGFGLLGSDQAVANTRPGALCRRFRCTTVASDHDVRVVQLASRDSNDLEYESHAPIWRPSGRVTRLGDYAAFHGGIGLWRLALSGRFVAYATDRPEYQYGTSDFTVSRLNAENGRRESLSLRSDYGGCTGGGIVPQSQVSAIVVSDVGTVGWIMAELGPFSATTAADYHVCALLPRSRTPKVLAHGTAIDRHVLALRGHRLHWREDGEPRFATIPSTAALRRVIVRPIFAQLTPRRATR
jgi:hypothetical protein